MKLPIALLTIIASCGTIPNSEIPDSRMAFKIQDPYFQGEVECRLLSTGRGFKILLKDPSGEILDHALFQYPAYMLDTGDINRDGRTDILLGLIKPTEFDPMEKKRLFILRIDDGNLRPLWLGSRVCQELIDFKSSAEGKVQTLERNRNGMYAVGDYRWQGFGLTLIRYTHDELPLRSASKLFYKD